jgi:hypothetical protein
MERASAHVCSKVLVKMKSTARRKLCIGSTFLLDSSYSSVARGVMLNIKKDYLSISNSIVNPIQECQENKAKCRSKH